MGVGRSNPISALAMAPALFLLAGCGGSDDAPVANAVGIPAEVAIQSESNLAELPEDADDLPQVSWRAVEMPNGVAIELHEEDDHVSLLLRCGGTPARLQAVVPGFRPSSAGELMRLAIGRTEVALAEPITSGVPGTAPLPPMAGSVGEAMIPANLPQLFADAQAIDVVQGVQRIGATPAPPRALGQAFATACVGRAS